MSNRMMRLMRQNVRIIQRNKVSQTGKHHIPIKCFGSNEAMIEEMINMMDVFRDASIYERRSSL